MNNERRYTLPSSPEARSTRYKRMGIPLGALALVATAMIGLGKVGVLKGNPQEPRGSYNDTATTKPYTSIALDKGARLRTTPEVIEESGDGTHNRLAELEDAATAIPTPEGIKSYESHSDGEWYGVNVDDIEEIAPDLADELEKDKDGVAWVNEQKATPKQ